MTTALCCCCGMDEMDPQDASSFEEPDDFGPPPSSEGDEAAWDCAMTHSISWTKDDEGCQVANSYRFLERLGSGSYGEVSLVERMEGDPPYRLFAAKVMSKARLKSKSEYVNTPEGGMKKVTALDKVYREIAIMRHLYHRNVVLLFEVMDDSEDEGESPIVLITEYMKLGPTMVYDEEENKFCSPRHEDGVIPEEEAKVLLRDLLLGLQYLREQRVAHRDIKPDNLLLFENGTLRICDYGCAVQFPEREQQGGSEGDERTEALLHDTTGTYTFQSPESISGDPYNAYETDLWAGGVTLYCWLFGYTPFYYEGLEPLFEAIREEPLDVGDALGPEVCSMLRGLLHKDLDSRLSLEEALEHEWLADVPPPPSPS